MKLSGLQKQGADALNPEDVPLSKKFMEAEPAEQKLMLQQFTTVTDIQQILPKNIESLDKDTAKLVLEKVLGLCGVPKSTTTTQAEQQKSIQLQIDVLKKRHKENAKLLQEHQRVKNRRRWLERNLETYRRHLENIEGAFEELPEEQRGNLVLGNEQVSAGIRRKIEEVQNELNRLESPLRD